MIDKGDSKNSKNIPHTCFLGEPLRLLRSLASGYPLHHLRGTRTRGALRRSVVPLLSLSLPDAKQADRCCFCLFLTVDAHSFKIERLPLQKSRITWLYKKHSCTARLNREKIIVRI
jgi:hypothetical protein